MGTNYHLRKNSTYNEKYKMYMKLKKDELVKMLIECNKQLDMVSETVKAKKFYKNYTYDPRSGDWDLR